MTLVTNPAVKVSVGTPRPRGTRRGGPLVPILETHRLIILETLLVRKIARAREIARTRGGFLQWTNVRYCTDRVTPSNWTRLEREPLQTLLGAPAELLTVGFGPNVVMSAAPRLLLPVRLNETKLLAWH